MNQKSGSDAKEHVGSPGLEALSTGVRRQAPEAERFKATLWQAVFGEGVFVENLHASQHVVRRSSEDVTGFKSDDAILIAVSQGRATVQQDEREAEIHAGDAVLLRSGAPYRYGVDDDTKLTIVSVPRAKLPATSARLLRHATAIALPPSTLVRAAVSFFSQLTGKHSEERPTSALGSTTATLMHSVIVTQNVHDANDELDSVLVSRIERIVRENAGSQDLSPQFVADALHVSVRRLHRLFEGRSTTVAQYIRQTRLEMVALHLRNPGPTISRAEIAQQYGFAGVDQCARAFKLQFGMTMTEYGARWLVSKTR